MSSADEARQFGDDELLMRWLDERNEHEARIGPDACLLEWMTADRVAFANDALGSIRLKRYGRALTQRGSGHWPCGTLFTTRAATFCQAHHL